MSRSDPPVFEMSLAELMTNVRRLECDEQPTRPRLRYASANQFTTLCVLSLSAVLQKQIQLRRENGLAGCRLPPYQ